VQVVITGGAGFVGSSLALNLRRDLPSAAIVAVDNLKRRGSERNLSRFKAAGVQFLHGDTRVPSDFSQIQGAVDLVIDASAEPSVLAGTQGTPRYLLDTNLAGTWNCLEFARERSAQFIFLSTSRVYSIEPLLSLPLAPGGSRFEWQGGAIDGASTKGIAENFPTHLPRSLYGATKLASEQLVQEYSFLYGLKSAIYRCGVLCGAGQFGKVDQGVFTLWMANHFFGVPLTYMGFDGMGKQVRDLLHPSDLYSLVRTQMGSYAHWNGETYNVGGGMQNSVSLRELTDICREITGREVPIGTRSEQNKVDIPWYVTDSSKCQSQYGWEPKVSLRQTMTDIYDWLKRDSKELESLFLS
jgi:CDP-paratose 2-epimerase